MKTALIPGVPGQHGSYFATLLLHKDSDISRIRRRSSLSNTDRIDHLYQNPHEQDRRFILHHGDMIELLTLVRILQQVQPDELCNLAAQSQVSVSLEEPE